jgi:exosortase A
MSDPMNLNNPSNPRTLHLVFIIILLGLFIASYYDVLGWMYGRFAGADSYYSHGFLIPFVSAFFIWLKRERLKEVEPQISWWGLSLIILAVLVHLAGTILYVFSLSGFSIFFLIMGITLFLFGKKFTKEILFPLFFLLLMFPLPQAFISVISMPMKMLVAKTGVAVVSMMGIPVFREGFNITIPAGTLLVGNPCSGLRSLIAFLALGAVFAYISDLNHIKKIILFLLAVPVALISNMIRVPILILISHYYGLEAAAPETLVHTGSGMLVFILGVAMLFFIGRSLEGKKNTQPPNLPTS